MSQSAQDHYSKITFHCKYSSYTRRQLYELVSDVDNYHHFVPYCVASDVLSSELIRDSDSEREFEKKRAQLTVGFLAFKESYVSEVTCKPCESVEVNSNIIINCHAKTRVDAGCRIIGDTAI